MRARIAGARAARRQAAGRERGAVMVEAVIGLPIMVLLAFGILSFGQAYSNANITSGSTRTGARLASATYAPSTTKTAQATAIATAVAADLSNLKSATPVEMWMYHADNAGLPPSGSAFSVCSGDCIKWTWNATTGAWNTAVGAWTDPNGCGQTLDYVGIYVKVTAQLNTGLFGTRTINITQRTSMRVEPVSNVLC